MTNRIIYNVMYDLPRVNISMPARQNRSKDGVVRITPGMFEPIEFDIGNMDGVPINLAHFRVKFVAWKNNRRDSTTMGMVQSDIVFAKTLLVEDPYAGRFVMMLDDDDTFLLSRPGMTSLRWSLFMINDDDQVFPAQVTASGGRYGQLIIDIEAGTPLSQMILTA